MNKNLLFVLALTWVLVSCTTPGKFVKVNTKNDCEGTGQVLIKIGYGDSYLEATPRATAKRKGEIVYKLEPRKSQPSGIDYSTVVVTMEGKRDPEDKWLDNSAVAGPGNNKIFVCVPPTLPLGDYGFNVTVPGVGTIDPRVAVE